MFIRRCTVERRPRGPCDDLRVRQGFSLDELSRRQIDLFASGQPVPVVSSHAFATRDDIGHDELTTEPVLQYEGGRSALPS